MHVNCPVKLLNHFSFGIVFVSVFVSFFLNFFVLLYSSIVLIFVLVLVTVIKVSLPPLQRTRRPPIAARSNRNSSTYVLQSVDSDTQRHWPTVSDWCVNRPYINDSPWSWLIVSGRQNVGVYGQRYRSDSLRSLRHKPPSGQVQTWRCRNCGRVRHLPAGVRRGRWGALDCRGGRPLTEMWTGLSYLGSRPEWRIIFIAVYQNWYL